MYTDKFFTNNFPFVNTRGEYERLLCNNHYLIKHSHLKYIILVHKKTYINYHNKLMYALFNDSVGCITAIMK